MGDLIAEFVDKLPTFAAARLPIVRIIGILEFGRIINQQGNGGEGSVVIDQGCFAAWCWQSVDCGPLELDANVFCFLNDVMLALFVHHFATGQGKALISLLGSEIGFLFGHLQPHALDKVIVNILGETIVAPFLYIALAE